MFEYRGYAYGQTGAWWSVWKDGTCVADWRAQDEIEVRAAIDAALEPAPTDYKDYCSLL